MPLITKGCFKTALTFLNKEKCWLYYVRGRQEIISVISESDKNERIFFRIFAQSILFSVTEYSTEIMRLLWFLNIRKLTWGKSYFKNT